MSNFSSFVILASSIVFIGEAIMTDIRIKIIEEMTPDERFRRVVEILTAASLRLLKKQKEAQMQDAERIKKPLIIDEKEGK
ncbi:MAG TPA: hypothetical protein DD723_10065 [Candidatus Omnitrophica bacterium]|nr:hypothetical protein [Candidatus Omnitrophota bacterium]